MTQKGTRAAVRELARLLDLAILTGAQARLVQKRMLRRGCERSDIDEAEPTPGVRRPEKDPAGDDGGPKDRVQEVRP
jgi:hypothetical protein